MRYLFLFLFFSYSSISIGQTKKWISIDQSFYGMKYKLPTTWEVDGFSSSSVCKCSGTINIGDRYSKNELFMVAYPAATEEELTNENRTKVWNWKFQEKDEQNSFQSEKHLFQQTISVWTPESCKDEDEQDLEVWRFTTTGKGQYYVIYFWSSAKIMAKNEKLIHSILGTFKTVKVSDEDKEWWG